MIFDKCLCLRGRLRLTTARRLSAYMSSRALATTIASSCYYDVDKESAVGSDTSRHASESLDINQVKDELDALDRQRAKSEQTRITVDKELLNAANNTKKIEQVSYNHCRAVARIFIRGIPLPFQFHFSFPPLPPYDLPFLSLTP